MAYTSNTTNSVSHYFKRLGLSRALLMWCFFRQSLMDPHWKNEAAKLASAQNDAQLVHSWCARLPMNAAIESIAGLLLPCVLALAGALSLFGVMQLSGVQTTNIWGVLILFAFLPLVMSLLSLFSWFKLQRQANPHRAGVLLSVLLPLLKLRLTRLAPSDWPQSNTLIKWLFLRLQMLALSFQFGVWIAFLLSVLFEAKAFVWSSSLLNFPWLTIFEILALPWSWLVAAPSESLLQASLAASGMVPPNDLSVLSQWWSFIFYSLLVYGFLPRLALVLWVRWQLNRELTTSILESGDVERFISGVRTPIEPLGDHHSLSVNSVLKLEQNPDESAPQFEFATSFLHLSWYWAPPDSNVMEYTLGLASWAEDEAWLTHRDRDWSRPVQIWVALSQTPTEELVDVIELISRHTQHFEILVTCSTSADAVAKPLLAHKESWQLFAKKHQLPLSFIAGDPQ